MENKIYIYETAKNPDRENGKLNETNEKKKQYS